MPPPAIHYQKEQLSTGGGFACRRRAGYPLRRRVETGPAHRKVSSVNFAISPFRHFAIDERPGVSLNGQITFART